MFINILEKKPKNKSHILVSNNRHHLVSLYTQVRYHILFISCCSAVLGLVANKKKKMVLLQVPLLLCCNCSVYTIRDKRGASTGFSIVVLQLSVYTIRDKRGAPTSFSRNNTIDTEWVSPATAPPVYNYSPARPHRLFGE